MKSLKLIALLVPLNAVPLMIPQHASAQKAEDHKRDAIIAGPRRDEIQQREPMSAEVAAPRVNNHQHHDVTRGRLLSHRPRSPGPGGNGANTVSMEGRKVYNARSPSVQNAGNAQNKSQELTSRRGVPSCTDGNAPASSPGRKELRKKKEASMSKSGAPAIFTRATLTLYINKLFNLSNR